MLEEQTVELLPARTTMRSLYIGSAFGKGGNGGNGGMAISIAVNAGNISFGANSVVNQAVAIAIGGRGGNGGGGIVSY